MFDWDDLKYLLALARNGSTIAAAKALGVNQSTVQRRVAEFERKIGRPATVRSAGGYRLNEFGHSLLVDAERVEASVLDLERHIADRSNDISGVIRLTCPEPIVFRMTAFIERFHARYPGLRVEFVTSDRYLDLSKGDADVAFRSGDTDEELVGRKVADSLWAVYASRAYIEAHGQPAEIGDLVRHPLVAFDETLSAHRALQWLSIVAPGARMAARNNSVLGLVYSVRSGIGIGPLPTAIGDAEADLVRVLGPIPELARAWRLLAHPDVRRTPRVSAFFDFVANEKEALKAILTG
ncbi:LysR family transcriptional regulator [Mesorhizobium sp. NBSH29]|uniref:LysR family transcriptional regulator n=1 Tax=Mesorhizobium sp. NBSH29 TaxID=2654249 RepID=UPI00189697EC|nr:LysR family transcriptional regulator [Mesorhizobium sp. NBSH29]QPC85441.1 LysR family transcriptional regulator [Mesorhizobium sp. NBSH29]